MGPARTDKEPVVILGFGRSGTTWISDIVSKALGGMILFEPMHPAVFDRSEEYCYSGSLSQVQSDYLKSFLDKAYSGGYRHRWLIRNHVNSPLHEVSEAFIGYIWEEVKPIGYKFIRGNFLIDWFYENISRRIVYVERHPLAVVSSIIRRNRFWEEYGWEFHYKTFVARMGDTDNSAESKELARLGSSLIEREAQIAFMWGVTHKFVRNRLKGLGLPVFHYEDFYSKPFQTSRQLLTYLGEGEISIHPSYIFTPSMLTLRTQHELMHGEGQLDVPGPAVFWSKNFTEQQVRDIIETLDRMDIPVTETNYGL